MKHLRAPARGQILILALVFLAVFTMSAAALLSFVTSYARGERVAIAAAQSLQLAEGALDMAAYSLNQNSSYSGEVGTALGAGTYTIVVTSIDSNTKRITATGYVPNAASPTATRTIKASVSLNSSVVSFHYGLQTGNGGFTLNNSSQIVGNVYSTGPIIGNNSNYIYGDVVSAGPTGVVYGIHATSSVYAHTIGNASANTIVDKNAYYTTKTNTTVSGTSYPGSADQDLAGFPIEDDQITEWETEAAAGGTISSCDGSGDYTINSSQTLGPKKIACNLIIKGNSTTVTIAGPIWVTGNITFQTGPTIQMSSSLGSANVAIIADKPTNQSGSGIITVGQSTGFSGSGTSGSFVFLISQNNSAEQGGSTAAIALSQGASALVAYASHGLITLGQSVSVKEATGYKIVLSQSASVSYDTGLPSTLFQGGPGGSWAFVPGTFAISR